MTWEELRTVERADVYKAGRPVGVLERGPGSVAFRYMSGYEGPAVASTLPMGRRSLDGPPGSLPPFFAGLLPEGRRLTALRAAIKTSADDELSLLLAVGADAIGDVQVVPEGEVPALPGVEAVIEPQQTRFSDVFARAVGPDFEDPAALPGVQPKVSGRMISLPVAWAGRSCILKLNPPELPHLVENEAFFYEVARRSGVPCAETEMVRDVDGAAGLLVRRFDREVGGDGVWMRAQEDGCQVLRRYPADKYRVTTEAVLSALAGVTGAPVVAGRDLLRQVALAYLTCNGDAHAKNFSVGQAPDGEWVVTPAYDLPSSHPYGDTTMALRLDGRIREDIGRAQFLSLGNALRLPPKAVTRVLDQLLAAVPSWFDELDRLPFDERRVHKLRKAILYRVRRLEK